MRRIVALVLLITSAVGCNSSTDPVAELPRESPNVQRPDAHFDAGQMIYITEKGFVPELLVTVVNEAIVWTNETNEPVSIIFDNKTVRSGPIEPGDSFSFTPDVTISITYHVVSDKRIKGAIQVEQAEASGQN